MLGSRSTVSSVLEDDALEARKPFDKGQMVTSADVGSVLLGVSDMRPVATKHGPRLVNW